MAQSKLRRRALQRVSNPSSSSTPHVPLVASVSDAGANKLRVKLPLNMTKEELKRYKQLAVVRERQKRVEAKRQGRGSSENQNQNQNLNLLRMNMKKSDDPQDDHALKKQTAVMMNSKDGQRAVELNQAQAEAVRREREREKLRSVHDSYLQVQPEKRRSKLRPIDREEIQSAKQEAIRREKDRRVRVSKRPVPVATSRAKQLMTQRGGRRRVEAAESKQRRVRSKGQRFSSAELNEYKVEAMRKEVELGKSSHSKKRMSVSREKQRMKGQPWMGRLSKVFHSMADEDGEVNLVDLRYVLQDHFAEEEPGARAVEWTTKALQHLDLTVHDAERCSWADISRKAKETAVLSAKEKRRRAERMLSLCRAGYVGLAKATSRILPEELDDVLLSSLRANHDLKRILGDLEAPSVASVLPAKHVSLHEYEKVLCQLLHIEHQEAEAEAKPAKPMHTLQDLSVHVQTDSVYLPKQPPSPPLQRCNRGTQYTPVSAVAKTAVTFAKVDKKLPPSHLRSVTQKKGDSVAELQVVDAAIQSLRTELNKSANPASEQEANKGTGEEEEKSGEYGLVYKGRCWLSSQDLLNLCATSTVCAEVSVIQAMGPFRLYIRVLLEKNGQEGVRRIGIAELTRLAKESSKQIQGCRPLVSAMHSACSEKPTLLTKPERARLRKSGVEKWTTSELERAIAAEESIREWVESGRVPEQSTLIQWLLLHCVVRYDSENDQRRLTICLPGDDEAKTVEELKPNRVGANRLIGEEDSFGGNEPWKDAVKALEKGMERKISARFDQDKRNALIIAHNKLGVSGKRTIPYAGFLELLRHFCGEFNSSAASALSQKFVAEKPGVLDLHKLFFEVVDIDGFLDLWQRSVRGWKAWEINDVFQDYDASKSGMLSLASFVSVLQEEMLMKVPYWKLVVLHYQFIVKGNLMSYRKFIKFIVKRLSSRVET